MPPIRCRILTEYVLAGTGTFIGFAFFILGLLTNNLHTLIWGWFSGFCALRVFLLQSSFLKLEIHDKFNPEQLSKFKIIIVYLLLASVVASSYYLPLAIFYNKPFSILNPENFISSNYWPPLISSLLSTVWLTLLLFNVIIYRKYLLTENIPNVRPADESTHLLD